MVYQGFLLGTFLNGATAFSFDSILQTTDDVSSEVLLLLRYLQLAESMRVSPCSFGATPLSAQTCPSSRQTRRVTTLPSWSDTVVEEHLDVLL